MQHIHILDPQLLDEGGHYLNYATHAARELRRRGHRVSVYGRRECRVTCDGLRPEAIFSHDIFTEVGRDAEVWALENFHAVNQAFLGDLARIGAERIGPDDLVFFPSLHQNQLYAVALWLARMPAARRPAVAVLLRYLTPEMDYVQNRANRELLGHLFRYGALALRAAQPRSVFCADTREMSAAFGALLGQPVLEVPVAMDPPASFGPGRPRATRPTVVYQGHLSELKGFHLLPEIIVASMPLTPRPRFVVQVQGQPPAALAPFVEWFGRQPAADVRRVGGALTSEGYFALMAEADVVLLPYKPTYYAHCSSGVFAEAAAAGKVIVVPDGTVAARQAREFALGAVIARDWSASALAEALAEALRDWEELDRRARAAAEPFRDAQSVRAFWERIFSAISPPAASAAA